MKNILVLVLLMILGCGCTGKLQDRNTELEKENERLKLANKTSPFQHINDRLIEQQKDKYPPSEIYTQEEYEVVVVSKMQENGQKEMALEMKNLLEQGETLINFIDSINKEAIMKSGGYDDSGWMKNRKDKNGTNAIMIAEGNGKELKNRIIAYRNSSILILDKYLKKEDHQIYPMIDLECEERGTLWENHVFKNMPIGAIQPMLTKFKNDIHGNGSSILGKLNKIEK